MKKRAVTLLLCLVLVVLSLLRGFAASAAGIIPATNADFDVPCAAAILIDEDSGTVLYEKNADARRPIASITKVMTLLLAFEALEAGKIHLDDFVPVSEHAYHMGGSQIWLEPGEQMTLDDMLKAICISSANDAAVAVAEYVGGSETAFAEMMNVRAYELGMTNTHFVNACGLDEAGHLSTARDVALMSREMLLHHTEVRDYCSIWMDTLRGGATQLVNTNKTAMQYALVGGECLLKPVPRDGAFDFAAIRRDCYVPLARDAHGSLLAVGTMERHSVDGRQYALLERRTAGADGLTIETRLFELNGQTLGRCVPLATLPACAELVPQLVLPGVQGVGLAVLKTPLMNCVDGSTDAVSIYAPAAGLLHALARCEEQLNAEFANGASRVFASEDLLRPDAQGRRALQDDLFVGLPDDPANVGVTVYSPALREGSYLARKQDLLRGCESLLGLRRGILSEVETPAEPRTATEITATSVDYDLTIRDLQSAWTDTVQQAMALCSALGAVYGLDGLPQTAAPAIDWGDGVLYDRARIWAEQRELVDAGLLRPELALAWYFDLPHETEAELAEIRRRFMGDAGRAQ